MRIGSRFILLVAAYLAFAGTVGTDECVAAVAGAAALTAFSLIAHRPHPLRFHFHPLTVLRQVLSALPKLPADSVRVLPALLAADPRIWRMSQEFAPGQIDGADPARWAVFILAMSLPPNSYLIARLARPGEIVVHRLAPPS